MNSRSVNEKEAVAAVILAAGFSSRMGAFKPLLQLGNSTMIEKVVDTVLQVAERVLVVVGFQKERIMGLRNWEPQVVFVVNENYPKGMFSSVKAGVAQVKEARFFIALADQPHIPIVVYRQLLAAASAADVILPVYQNRRGHPLLLSSAVREAILRADENDPTVTLKRIISRFNIHEVAIEQQAIHFDIDTPEDYRRLREEGIF